MLPFDTTTDSVSLSTKEILVTITSPDQTNDERIGVNDGVKQEVLIKVNHVYADDEQQFTEKVSVNENTIPTNLVFVEEENKAKVIVPDNINQYSGIRKNNTDGEYEVFSNDEYISFSDDLRGRLDANNNPVLQCLIELPMSAEPRVIELFVMCPSLISNIFPNGSYTIRAENRNVQIQEEIDYSLQDYMIALKEHSVATVIA